MEFEAVSVGRRRISMLEAPSIDARGDHPGCPKHGKNEPPTAHENSTYVDLFCDCHAFKEPLILSNGTDIAWPGGWTGREADSWRTANGLERPPS